jgi:hypothetical protein
MAHKKKHGNPVPSGNQPRTGPSTNEIPGTPAHANGAPGESFQEQDPKRRIGNYEGAGEHAYQQPGGKNDANRERGK